MKKSIIICAYNEAPTIEDVMMDVITFNPHDEIIVVDDGSTDNTSHILNKLKLDHNFKLITFSENKGKSYAMVKGVENSSFDLIVFFDADVKNIQSKHFELLCNPLLSGETDMVLGQPHETWINHKLNPFRSLTGERALWKHDIEPILEEIRHIRFGVETYLNLYYISEGKKISNVLMEGLLHPTKFQKTDPIKASTELIEESQEILNTYFNNPKLVYKSLKKIIHDKQNAASKNYKNWQSQINTELTDLKNKWRNI